MYPKFFSKNKKQKGIYSKNKIYNPKKREK